jgi:hypothetical protein
MRKDLPNDFPFQVFDAGFAVVRIRFVNQSGAPVSLEPASMAFYSPKKKELKTAEPTEIAPKILKYYHGSGPVPVHGDVTYGNPYPPSYPNPNIAHARGMSRTGTISAGPGKLDAGTGPALRDKLEEYRLKPVTVEPGGEVEGFMYLKSKQSGRALSGGWVIVDGQKVAF